jgi:two-component system chemotaxis response regulator CheY
MWTPALVVTRRRTLVNRPMQSALALRAVANELLPSILIVDGDADTRLLYRTLLAEHAGGVSEAEDGAEALGKAICRPPDVVLMETRLRRIDGYQLCAQLRREDATSHAAIVVVTSAAQPEDLERAAAAGADHVLVKPCAPGALLDATLRTWRHRLRLGAINAAERS